MQNDAQNTAKTIKKYIEKRMLYEKETIAKKTWKLIQLLTKKKQKYRQRVKESTATATAANLVTEQNDDSAFSQAHIRSRSIQKVAKTLPKSPRKRKKVISALTNKFKLRIKPTQSKAGRPKTELTESEKEWLKNFLDKPDIT